MKKDILIVIRDILKADATILTYITAADIKVADLPESRKSKQITLREDYGKSNSIITSANPTVFVTVWVKEKDNAEPYKTCSTIVRRAIDLLNRKGTTLNSGDLIINQITKTDASIKFDSELRCQVGVIVFDCVTND
jgi:hypothetical protein